MDVTHVAKLANLPLTSEESLTYAAQLKKVLEYIEQLQSLDLSNVTPTSQSINIINATREDSLAQPLELVNTEFKVPGILDND